MFGNSQFQIIRNNAAARQTPQPALAQNLIFMLVLVFQNSEIQISNSPHQGHAHEKTPRQECPRPRWGPPNDPGGARGPFEHYNRHSRQQESAISEQGMKP